jgi:hypothetical protein
MESLHHGEVTPMKRMAGVLIAMGIVAAQLPAWGVETVAAVSGKDLCLLYSQDCPNQAMTIQTKISRLREEIGKGSTVYTPVELRRLQSKLEEAEWMYYVIMYSPGRR